MTRSRRSGKISPFSNTCGIKKELGTPGQRQPCRLNATDRRLRHHLLITHLPEVIVNCILYVQLARWCRVWSHYRWHCLQGSTLKAQLFEPKMRSRVDKMGNFGRISL